MKCSEVFEDSNNENIPGMADSQNKPAADIKIIRGVLKDVVPAVGLKIVEIYTNRYRSCYTVKAGVVGFRGKPEEAKAYMRDLKSAVESEIRKRNPDLQFSVGFGPSLDIKGSIIVKIPNQARLS